MSIDFYASASLPYKEVVGGRLRRYGIREHINSKGSRTLTDGVFYLHVGDVTEGWYTGFTTYGFNHTALIEAALFQEFGIAHASHYDLFEPCQVSAPDLTSCQQAYERDDAVRHSLLSEATVHDRKARIAALMTLAMREWDDRVDGFTELHWRAMEPMVRSRREFLDEWRFLRARAQVPKRDQR